MVDLGDIQKVAKLAKITLTPEEAVRFSNELAQVFKWVEQLESLCLQEPPSCPASFCPMVKDIPEPTPGVKRLLSSAPESRSDCFIVPNVLGEC